MRVELLLKKGLLTKVYTHNGFTKVVKNEGDWARNIFHMKDLFDLVNVDDSVKPDSPNIINFQTVDDVQTLLVRLKRADRFRQFYLCKRPTLFHPLGDTSLGIKTLILHEKNDTFGGGATA